MMITHNKSGVSSQECVGIPMKLLPTILQSKDRPKIQDPEKIQDTYDMATKEDTRCIANEATLLLTKKVRWKDNAETIMATKKQRNV